MIVSSPRLLVILVATTVEFHQSSSDYDGKSYWCLPVLLSKRPENNVRVEADDDVVPICLLEYCVLLLRYALYHALCFIEFNHVVSRRDSYYYDGVVMATTTGFVTLIAASSEGTNQSRLRVERPSSSGIIVDNHHHDAHQASGHSHWPRSPPKVSVTISLTLSFITCSCAMKLAVVFFLSNVILATIAQETETFGNCTLGAYYTELDGSFETWTIPQLFQLLNATHRKSLPIIGKEGELNANNALIDLDSGYESSEDPMVRLHLRDIDFEASTLNTPEGWRRGDLWPHQRNAGPNTLAGSDVHAKRPVDWEVNTVTANLFWGECGTVEDPARCVTPAVPDQNTAPTTAQDGKIKTPPASLRGDIARSLFYTQVRYSEDLQLKLTDCPPFEGNEYGYLSELLRWHIEDPVDDRERERNDKACSKWQGNRNPFVDYPAMVSRLFGEPDSILEGTRTYSRCKEATISPTATPNACSSLEPGDVNVIIFNSDPVDQIVFFPLNNIPESVGSLFITDRAWDGEKFASTEGTLEVCFRTDMTQLLT